MALVLVTPPAIEPIALADAKAHLRVDGFAEDILIGSLILTSRLHIEAALGLALITQAWQLTLDAFPPGRAFTLPLQPVSAITSILTTDATGITTTLSADLYPRPRSAAPHRSNRPRLAHHHRRRQWHHHRLHRRLWP